MVVMVVVVDKFLVMVVIVATFVMVKEIVQYMLLLFLKGGF